MSNGRFNGMSPLTLHRNILRGRFGLDAVDHGSPAAVDHSIHALDHPDSRSPWREADVHSHHHTGRGAAPTLSRWILNLETAITC